MAKIPMERITQMVLREKILKFKEDHGLTWKLMQGLSLKEEYNTPCEWQTFFNITKNIGAHPNMVKKVLDFFQIPCTKTNLFVTLDKTKKE